jgi:hypothetical protein
VRILVGLLVIPVLFGQVDPKALLRQSVENYNRNWRAGMGWAYTTTEVTDSDGEKDVTVTEVIPVAGTPYDRAVVKGGQKLKGDDAAREEQKFEKACRDREKESPADRAARLRKIESQHEFAREVPEAYDAKLIGEETVDGRPAWILELTPRADYRPVSTRAAMLKHIGARLWIDKQEVQWVKAQAHVIDTISIGWVLARIGPGADITFQQTRVADRLWMPAKVRIEGTAKIFLVHDKDLTETVTFTGYHRPEPPVLSASESAARRRYSDR